MMKPSVTPKNTLLASQFIPTTRTTATYNCNFGNDTNNNNDNNNSSSNNNTKTRCKNVLARSGSAPEPKTEHKKTRQMESKPTNTKSLRNQQNNELRTNHSSATPHS
eukprot:3224822-Amphidinium_carterae.1